MKRMIAGLISREVGLSVDEVIKRIEIPSDDKLGDYAFPCFVLAKKLKRNPVEIAKKLSDKLNQESHKGIYILEAGGAYVNFFLDRREFARKVFEELGENFGSSETSKNRKIVIEFSQPNTHKAFHVGHIRGTSVGESLARILEFNGAKVSRVNYSGDTGMHIAKWIWCYQKYHSKEKLKDDENWIAEIYVDAVKRLEKNEKLQEEVDEINLKIETKSDNKINKLWKETRKSSIKFWDRIYEELNTHFDKNYFESEFEIEGRVIAEGLWEKGIAKKDDAIFMDLKKSGLGVWVLSRKDGTVLYSAKDIALAYKKIRDFPADRYLIAVADEQRLHFQQLMKTLELMKFPKREVYNFVTFGLVRFPEGKMSSRSGNNILYSDFVKEVSEIAKKGLVERGGKGKDLDEKSLKIAIAAIKYSMLKQDLRKVLIFNPKEAVSFEGDTGAYLLYSYARANSIIKKVKSYNKIRLKDLEYPYIGDIENRLLKKINDFPDVVGKAYQNLAPNIIANYSFELAKIFNEFYHGAPVLGSKEEKFRLKLVGSFRVTLRKSLDLLGIDVLEEM